MSDIQKAFAYITHENRLLVFEHVHHPEAGIQIPAGTIAEDETPETAVLREAYEETGLVNLNLEAFLGIHEHDRSQYGEEGVHVRHYFHLSCTGIVPESWEHREEDPSEGDEKPLFHLYWVNLDAVPPLIRERDYFIPALRIRLRNAG